MKKLMLTTAFLTVAAISSVPLSASAATINKTVHIAARGAMCETQGYITPNTLAVAAGDRLNLRFKNEQPTKLEVTGIPGGAFVVPGNSMVERSFTVTDSLEYAAWLEQQDCLKARASIDVKPASQAQNLFWSVTLAFVGGGIVWLAAKRRRMLAKWLPTSVRNARK